MWRIWWVPNNASKWQTGFNSAFKGLNRPGGGVSSVDCWLTPVVRISGSNAGYTMFRGSVKGNGYPLHSPVSPSLPLPCVTVCHHVSTGLYYLIRAKLHASEASSSVQSLSFYIRTAPPAVEFRYRFNFPKYNPFRIASFHWWSEVSDRCGKRFSISGNWNGTHIFFATWHCSVFCPFDLSKNEM